MAQQIADLLDQLAIEKETVRSAVGAIKERIAQKRER